jgi:hypothetical protein
VSSVEYYSNTLPPNCWLIIKIRNRASHDYLLAEPSTICTQYTQCAHVVKSIRLLDVSGGTSHDTRMKLQQTETASVSDLTLEEWAIVAQIELDERGGDSFYFKNNRYQEISFYTDDDDDEGEDFDPDKDTSFQPRSQPKPLLQEGRYKKELLEDIELAEIIEDYLGSHDSKSLKKTYKSTLKAIQGERGDNVFIQSERWPIAKRLSEHSRIFDWVEYAREIKKKPSNEDCELAAIIAHGEYAFGGMFPGPQMGFALGVCLHDVLHEKCQGKRRQMIKMGRTMIKKIQEFRHFATLHKLKLGLSLYVQDVQAGFKCAQECLSSETNASTRTKTLKYPTCLPPAPPSTSRDKRSQSIRARTQETPSKG